MAKINVIDGNIEPEQANPAPQPEPSIAAPQAEPVQPPAEIQPVFAHPESVEAQPVQAEPPIQPAQPPLDQITPPETTPPSEAVSDNIPHFGEMQPKVDAHPLFSGATEPPPARKGLLKKTLWPVMALVVAVTILYLVVDAGLIKGYSHLPFHFFKAPVSSTTPTIAPVAQTTQTTTPVASTTVDPYTGWKTYSKNGYEFKYPSDWVLVDGQSFGTVNSPDFKSTGLQSRTVTSGITVYFDKTDIPQTNITADNYQSSTLYSTSYSNFEKKTINNTSVVQYHINDSIIRTVFFRNDGIRIGARTEFATVNKDANLKTYDLILASVKY